MTDPERYEPDDPRAWLQHAREDFVVATADLPGVGSRLYCYHAQQAAEKAIKAVCIAADVRFPYTHDIRDLLKTLESGGVTVPAAARPAEALTRYAVAGRCPGPPDVSPADRTTAVEQAQAVVAWAESFVARAAPGNVRERRPPFPAPQPLTDLSPVPAALERLLADVVARVVDVASPERIILFGSAARGTFGERSDLDLLIVKAGDYDARALNAAIRRELHGVGVAVDLVIATPERLERYGGSWALVYRPALEEGRELYHA